jgi:hypothetical protein
MKSDLWFLKNDGVYSKCILPSLCIYAIVIDAIETEAVDAYSFTNGQE